MKSLPGLLGAKQKELFSHQAHSLLLLSLADTLALTLEETLIQIGFHLHKNVRLITRILEILKKIVIYCKKKSYASAYLTLLCTFLDAILITGFIHILQEKIPW